jgi:hypothetical protein
MTRVASHVAARTQPTEAMRAARMIVAFALVTIIKEHLEIEIHTK